MEQRPQHQIDKREQEEQESRGAVTIPYLKGLSEQFRRTANRHSFRIAFKPGRKFTTFGCPLHKALPRLLDESLHHRCKLV